MPAFSVPLKTFLRRRSGELDWNGCLLSVAYISEYIFASASADDTEHVPFRVRVLFPAFVIPMLSSQSSSCIPDAPNPAPLVPENTLKRDCEL